MFSSRGNLLILGEGVCDNADNAEELFEMFKELRRGSLGERISNHQRFLFFGATAKRRRRWKSISPACLRRRRIYFLILRKSEKNLKFSSQISTLSFIFNLADKNKYGYCTSLPRRHNPFGQRWQKSFGINVMDCNACARCLPPQTWML